LKRRGITVLEGVVALAVLLVLGVLVARATVWGLRERARMQTRQAALEVAANVLEAGRSTPVEQLDQDWAAAQKLSAETADLLPEGAVVVTVEPERSLPRARRLTVEVRWRWDADRPPQSVRLTTLLSPRTATTPGGKP
jgi:hypothetical protein